MKVAAEKQGCRILEPWGLLTLTRVLFLVLIVSAGAVLVAGCAADGAEDDPQELIAAGEPVYDQNCARCHGDEGTGDGGYPALADNDFVTGEPNSVIDIVVDGRGEMPAFGNELDNEEIAAVVSYIRNTWGNDASVVTPEDVEAAR